MWYLALGFYMVIGWFTPWWSFILISAGFGAGAPSAIRAARDGALSMTLAWWMLIYFLNLRGHGIVGERLSHLFGLTSYHLFIFLIGIGAGVVGAIAATMGFFIRRGMRVPVV